MKREPEGSDCLKAQNGKPLHGGERRHCTLHLLHLLHKWHY